MNKHEQRTKQYQSIKGGNEIWNLELSFEFRAVSNNKKPVKRKIGDVHSTKNEMFTRRRPSDR